MTSMLVAAPLLVPAAQAALVSFAAPIAPEAIAWIPHGLPALVAWPVAGLLAVCSLAAQQWRSRHH